MERNTGPGVGLEEMLRAYIPVFFLGTREPWQATAELSSLGGKLGMEVCVFNPGEGLKRKGRKWESTDPLELLDRIVRNHVRNQEGDSPVLWILQLFVSPLWLRRFRFGPAEWLWRSLTYGRLQPMLRAVPA